MRSAGAVPPRRPFEKIDAVDGVAAVDQPPDAGAFDPEHLRRRLGDLIERPADVPLPEHLGVHQIGERLAARRDLAFDVAQQGLFGGTHALFGGTRALGDRPARPPAVRARFSAVRGRRLTIPRFRTRFRTRSRTAYHVPGARNHRPSHVTRQISDAAQPAGGGAVLSGMMKIVIPGGTGQVGGLLARSLRSAGHDVVVISRAGGGDGRGVRWDGRTLGPWAAELDGADVVINLAGRTVNCRYTNANMKEMMSSRVDSTRAVGLAIARAARPPRVWLQMSTATIYAHRFDARQRRGDRTDRRRRARRARVLAVQRRHRQGVGTARRPTPRRRRPARSRCARRWS